MSELNAEASLKESTKDREDDELTSQELIDRYKRKLKAKDDQLVARTEELTNKNQRIHELKTALRPAKLPPLGLLVGGPLTTEEVVKKLRALEKFSKKMKRKRKGDDGSDSNSDSDEDSKDGGEKAPPVKKRKRGKNENRRRKKKPGILVPA